MIKATGKKNGKTLTVEYKDGQFYFNGAENIALESEMMTQLYKMYPIGGTYYVEEYDDPLNIIETMRQYFFDRPVDVETDETVEMPNEDGVIY